MSKNTLSSSSIAASIRETIDLEAKTLAAVSKAVDGSYAAAVKLILSCRGKVVVTGIGKSGLIAQKIAATMASTGTPALFLHPAEGLHGDLGLLEKRDLVIAIGKSGESEELNAMLPFLKKLGVKIVAITASPKSSLAKAADAALITPIAKEACPLDLAPTASTTASLAVGDALAVSLMRLRGFSKERFARLHPGGQLGKRLTLTVADVMRGGADNPTVRLGAGVPAMLVEITRKKSGAVSVVDAKGRLVGLVTDFDIRHSLENGADVRALPIKALMNPNPSRIRQDALAVEAVSMMEDRPRPFSVLPVVDAKNRSVGMIQIHDLRARGL